MSSRSDLEAELERLYRLRTHGIKPGLERVRAVLRRMGNPERHVAVVHVAGTNGKGSVGAMLASIIRCAGYKTGLYTSPHLVRMNERLIVNGRQISDRDLLELILCVRPHADAVSAEMGDVTFFEYTTALAFEYFRRKETRVVVLEAGMGGRFDATNVVAEPLISVITRISVEHTEYLGHDIVSIAGEKGGIIKKGRPVVTGDMPAAAEERLAEIARLERAPMVKAREVVSVVRVRQLSACQKLKISSTSTEYPPVMLPLLGRHQVENCATAVAAAEMLDVLVHRRRIGESAIIGGLENVGWPGRCEVLSKSPPVILDGAHNPSAAEMLAATLKELAKGRDIGIVIGVCVDKDVEGILGCFTGVADRYWAVTIDNERAMPARDLVKLMKCRRVEATETTIGEAMGEARKWARKNRGIVCITGSLYLVGEVKQLLEAEKG